MRRYPLAGYFALLFAVLIGAVLLFAALLYWQLQEAEEAALKRRTVRQAQSIAMAIEPALQQMSSAARLVSLMPDLAGENFAAVHARAQKALSGTGVYVIVVDSTGQQLFNTRLPYSETLPKTSNMPALKRALAAKKEVLSNVFMGSTSRRLVFNFIRPLPVGSTSKAAAVIVTRNAADLKSTINPVANTKGWIAGILDRSRAVVASTDERLPPGKPAEALAGFRPASDAGLMTPSQNAPRLGSGNIGGFARIGKTGWTAVTFGPAATAQSAVLASWPLLFSGGLVIFLCGLSMILLITRELKGSIEGIAVMAKEMAQGGVVSPADSRVREVDSVAKALSVASFERSENEDKINLISRELAHRTKNLMTIILSIVRQTARQSSSVQDMQQSLASRIQSLGHSIDLLTAKSWSAVSLKELIERQLGVFIELEEKVLLDGEDFQLKPEAVQNLGMAFHELATNSVKYGALSRSGGAVHIRWFVVNAADGETRGDLNLQWCESGGPPAQAPAASGFGMFVIKSHTEAAFNGTVEIDFDAQGFSWKLTAPVEQLTSNLK